MALPTNRIKKVKLPNGSVYTIVPELLQNSGYALNAPTLTADTTIATIDDLAGYVSVDDTDWILKNQATSIIVGNALTNINGKSLTSFHATDVTIGGYPAIKILNASDDSILSKDEAAVYMKAQTGSEFVPEYNYDNPKNSYFIFSDGTVYKPQWDSTNGLLLYYVTKLVRTSDLDGYVTLDTDQTITGEKTFYRIKITDGGNVALFNVSHNDFTMGMNGNRMITFASDGSHVTVGANLVPSANNSKDLGNDSHNWKDLYLSGNANVGSKLNLSSTGAAWSLQANGTNNGLEFAVNDSIMYTVKSTDVSPSTTNARDLGTSSLQWKDLYLAGSINIDGENVLTVSDTVINNSLVLHSPSQSAIVESLIPRYNNSYRLGSSTNMWKEAYISGQANVGTLAIAGPSNSIVLGADSNGDLSVDTGIIPLNSSDLGGSNNLWNDIYFSGTLKDGNSVYGLELPNTSSYTHNETIATLADIEALPNPMIFKGSVGDAADNPTIVWANLPAAAASNEGFTYKVITAHSTAPVCEVGDTIISSGSTWVVIPSGDEPVGTVTSVAMTVPTGLEVTGSPITSSGTLAVSYASGYSIPTTTKQTEWDNKATGSITTTTGSEAVTINNDTLNVVTRNTAQNITANKTWVQSSITVEDQDENVNITSSQVLLSDTRSDQEIDIRTNSATGNSPVIQIYNHDTDENTKLTTSSISVENNSGKASIQPHQVQVSNPSNDNYSYLDAGSIGVTNYNGTDTHYSLSLGAQYGFELEIDGPEYALYDYSFPTRSGTLGLEIEILDLTSL